MRKLILQLKEFWKEDFHWPTYLGTTVLLALLVAVNYGWGVADATVYNPKITGLAKLGLWIAFFGVPYLGVLGMQAVFRRPMPGVSDPRYWGMLALGFAVIIATISIGWHKELAKAWFPKELMKWGILLLWNLKRVAFTLLPLLLFWLAFDRKETPFYGLFTRPKGLKPYALMLLVVLPLVVGASFLPDFLKAYPQYKPGRGEELLGISPWLTCGLFELVYGFDFTIVELTYRGFLVIGLARWLGPRAVMPMVALYCILHFGKPMGEAIASIFGGYILGVAAYYSKNIWGGVLAHVGLAFMMEAAAHIQRAL